MPQEMYHMVENETQKSEFNMAVSYLNRLNVLFYACDEAAMSLNVYTWFHGLLALYRELSTELKKDEPEEYDKRISSIMKDVDNFLSRQRKTPNKHIPTELWMKLHKFEIDLRKIMDRSHLLVKREDDASFALR